MTGYPVYPETLRPGQAPDGQPLADDASAVPPPVILNGSALPKAAAVVVEIPSANDDVAPDSSTRSKDGADEGAVAETAAKVAEAPALLAEPAPPVETEIDEEAKTNEVAVRAESERAVKMRADRPDRPERRTRDRKGKGRSTAPPPVAPKADVGKSAPVAAKEGKDEKAAAPAENAVVAVAASAVAPVAAEAERAPSPDKSGPHAELDEKFFAEGVDSEQEMLHASAKSARPGMPIEDEIDPKILLKLHPDVRARREKYGSYAKWAVIVSVVLIGIAGIARYRNAQGSQEEAERQMAAYAAAHTYTEPTDKPPPAATAPTATTTAAASAVAAAPADSTSIPAPPDPANTVAPDKAALGPEAKTVAAAAPAASGAAAGSAQTDTETPPAKTAQQEKRDAQVLLDRGAFGRAIEAGERSVALDPTDGEAWLLLGAAYQSLGRAGDAKRSFNNCLKQGKKGPLGECRAMLQ